MEKTFKKLKNNLGKTVLISVGQAGFIIKSKSGQLLAIDLYLSNCVERLEGTIGYKRLLPALFSPEDIIFDYVIATHFHQDHYDYDSMPVLLNNEHTKLFAPVDCCKYVIEQNIPREKVTYIRPGDNLKVGDFDIYFVDCDHGDGAPDAIGVIVRVDGKVIYETGDTSYRPDYVDTLKRFGIFDVMIAPINGAFGNMNEEECSKYSKLLKPLVTIPCHYGMFAFHGGNPGTFVKKMDEICPENRYLLLSLGEEYDLGSEE